MKAALTQAPIPFFALIALILMLCVVLPAVAAAATLDGSSRSYLRAGEGLSSDNLRPGYEYLDLSLGGLGDPKLSFHFGGWGRYDFKQQTGNTDLQYAFLSYRDTANNAVVNLGRTLVFEGVAAERVDGIYARTDLASNFGLSLFGGRPAETNINAPGNDLIYGARISHHMPDVYRIGVSALQEEKNDADFREEAGIDLWVRPAGLVELLGRSAYDSVGNDWMEHSYDLVLGPFDRFRFVTQAWQYLYGPYFRATTTNAFAFGTGLLDPGEKATALGEEVQFTANDKVAVYANYRFFKYRTAGDAQAYGGRVNYSHGKNNAMGLSIMRMDGDDDRLQYIQYRLYAARRIGKVDLAVDLIDLAFDEGGIDDSYSAVLAALYEVTPSLRIGADAEYLTSSTVDRDVLLMAKIIYLFGFSTGGGQ
jgi:hypothetical protein